MADLPEFIYRSGERVKDLALFRHVDLLTGISFRDYPYGAKYIKLSVQTLLANGFVVRPDENQLMTQLWTNAPYPILNLTWKNS
jgi:hypothetical protein